MVETGGGAANLFVFLPFLVFGFGIIFLVIAAKDHRGTKDQGVKKLGARANHPLRHVQIALNKERKQAREAARAKEPKREEAPEAKPERKRRSGPPWLKRV